MAEIDESTAYDIAYDETSGRNVAGILTAMLAGAAVGAGLALLYAPSDGRETRDRVTEKVREVTDKIKQARWRAVDTAYKATEAALPDVGVWPGTPAEASGEERPTGGNGGGV